MIFGLLKFVMLLPWSFLYSHLFLMMPFLNYPLTFIFVYDISYSFSAKSIVYFQIQFSFTPTFTLMFKLLIAVFTLLFLLINADATSAITSLTQCAEFFSFLFPFYQLLFIISPYLAKLSSTPLFPFCFALELPSLFSFFKFLTAFALQIA